MGSRFHSVNKKQELLHAGCLGKALFLNASDLSLNATSLSILRLRYISFSQLLPLCASFSASVPKSCCSQLPCVPFDTWKPISEDGKGLTTTTTTLRLLTSDGEFSECCH